MPNPTSEIKWLIPSEFFTFEDEDEKEYPDFSENLPADLKDFKKKIQLIQRNDGMCVSVVAINIRDPEVNFIHFIPAYMGEAINFGVYDLVNDSYSVDCQSYCELGSIPINYKLCIKGSHAWLVDVPLPLSLIERYLTTDQKDKLEKWKLSLGNLKNFTIETIQVVNVY